MAVLQPIIDMAAVCHGHGVRHVVVSPGSRSAALTLAFSRHGGFEMHVCMDERSAGFIALGMAQQLGIPVVLICTSGSAAYNFAPAVAEAFFQQISLLILTADRPKEWLHQLDGQTIYQNEIYGQHVKAAFELAADYQHPDVHWAVNRIANEALLLASKPPIGPVHINVPIREPFYPAEHEILAPSDNIRLIKSFPATSDLSMEAWHMLLDKFEDSKKILIAVGQGTWDASLLETLKKISDEWHIPVLGDCISNLHDLSFIAHHDLFLGSKEDEILQPDLLITLGLSFISKEFKQFIRKFRPEMHWHIASDEKVADPMQSITDFIKTNEESFFETLFEKVDYQFFTENRDLENNEDYANQWSLKETQARRTKEDYLHNLSKINDLTLLDFVFKEINQPFQLHLANSMSVRYANALRRDDHFLTTYANRGTSGIDGCVSTAIGAAMVSHQPTLLVTGDVAFLYDRNGLLIQSLPANLKIVVLNNAGGNIFRVIDGPASLPELETFFETRHTFTAQRTCEDSDIEYFPVRDLSTLEATLPTFFESRRISLLEILTDPEENTRVWKGLKRLMK